MRLKLFFAAISFAFASCSLQKTTTTTAKTLNIYGSGVVQKLVLVNLKVNSEKFRAVYKGDASDAIAVHQKNAVSQAMIDFNADIIIEPAYEIITAGSGVSIVLTGYAGRYENFRQLAGVDTALFVNLGIQNFNDGREEMQPPPPVRKKSKAALVILAVLLGAGAVLGGSM